MNKLISIITLITYLISILIPNGITAESITNNAVFNNSNIEILKKIPISYGRIFETNTAKNEKLDIVVIQDFHCQPKVQKNIFNIIDYLDKKMSIGYFFTEGAPIGKINLSSLNEIYPEKIKIKILNKMIEQGLLSGLEYYAAINKNTHLYGIESWNLYINTIKIFQNIQKKEKYFLNNIEITEQNLKALKKLFYNKKMFIYDELYNSTNIKKDSIFFNKLNNLCIYSNINISSSYKNVKKFIDIIKNPQINIKNSNVSKDRNFFLKILKDKISFALYTQIINKQKNKTAEENLILLYTNAKPFLKNQEFQKYKYIETLKKKYELIKSFDIKKFLIEETILRQDIFDRTFTTRKTKETAFISQMIMLLKEYVSLHIQFEDLKQFNANIKKFKNTIGTSKITNKKEIIKILNNDLISTYYKNNIERNSIFVDVIKKRKNTKKTDILIVGGFHNDIIRIFEHEKIKYAVIMPNAEEIDTGHYKQILLDIKTSSDALSDGLLVLGLSKYKQKQFLLTWIKELRSSGFKDKEIIEIINKWANIHKNFWGLGKSDIKDSEFSINQKTIDLSDIILTSNSLSLKGWFIKVKKIVKQYLNKFKQPFIYRYHGNNKKILDVKTLKKMESNIKFFPFIQLMLGFDLYSSFSTIFMQSNGYNLEFIAIVFSLLAPISFFSSGIAGLIGDKISKRTLVVVSLFIHTLGTICFTVSGLSPILLLASQILPTIGISGLSVSLSPFLFKSLEKIGEKESFQEIYGANLALFWIIMSVSSLLGGTIAFLTNQMIVITIAAILDIVVLSGSFLFTHKETHKQNRKSNKELKKIIKESKKIKTYFKNLFIPIIKLSSNKKTLSIVLINIVVNNIFFVSLCFFLQPLLISTGLTIGALAPIYFAANMFQSLALHFIKKFSYIVEKQINRNIFFISMGVLVGLFAFTGHPIFLITLYVSMNFWQGTSSLTEISAVYEIIDDNMKSKWLAFKSMFGTIVASITQISISGLLSIGINGNTLIIISTSIIISASIIIPQIFNRENKNSSIYNETVNIINIKSLLSSA
ncbi:MAG: MFS transporter [Endomicrobiaceae bacterium]|nr:MFS transporter [Endomicrobiaceae bacterium]